MLVAAAGFSFPAAVLTLATERLASAGATDVSEEQPLSRALTGTLLDPSGAAIASAQVTLLAPDNKPVSQTSTDNAGSFRFENVAPANYTLDFQADGFRETRVSVNLATKRPAALRVTMPIAVLNETVNVATGDSAPLVSLENSENQNANTIDRNALDLIPVFDQDYITTMSRFLDDNASGTNGVTLVVNGIEANGPGVTPSAIQEVKINNTPYSARFSRPGRARLEIVTKSGTPAYHGSLNFLFRDSVIDSTALAAAEHTGFGPIAQTVPNPTHHFFGSGHIFHDFHSGDQFWIGYSYEHRSVENQNVGGTTLPSAATNTHFLEHEINVSDLHQFSPHWVNQLRFLVGHFDNSVHSINADAQLSISGLFTAGGAQADSRRTEYHFDGTDFATYAN